MSRNLDRDEALLERRMDEMLSPVARGSWRSRSGLRSHAAQTATNRSAAAAGNPKSSMKPSTQSPHERFEFFEEVSRDDWSIEYAAYDPELKRDVTIRVLSPRALEDSSIAEEFWSRAACLGQVEHANVARVYAVDRAQGWVVMERLRHSLEDRVAESEPLSSVEAIDILRQSLAGLAAFHERGHVHGGLCLSSLKLATDGTLKLADAQGFTPSRELALPECGRRQFAPEMASTNEFGEIGPWTDLYCLGFSLLQAMLGAKFDGLVDRGVLADSSPSKAWFRWHASPKQSLPPFEELLPEIPVALNRALTAMTSKRICDRASSATEVLAMLPTLAMTAATPLSNSGSSSDQRQALDDRQSDESGPGAVMVGQLSSVYSDAVEVAEEADWLTRLTDIDWLTEQIQRPQVFGPVAAICLGVMGLLLLSDKPEQPPVVSRSVERPLANNVIVTPQPSQAPMIEQPPPPPIAAPKPIIEEVIVAASAPPLRKRTKPTKAALPRPRTLSMPDVPRWPLNCPAGDRDAARRLLRELVEDHWDANYWNKTALLCQAERVHLRLKRLAPEESRVDYALGLLLLEYEEYAKAEAAFDDACQVEEKWANKMHRLARSTGGSSDPAVLFFGPRRERLWIRLMRDDIDRLPSRVDVCAMEVQKLLHDVMRTSDQTQTESDRADYERYKSVKLAAQCHAWITLRRNGTLSRELSVAEWSTRVRGLLEGSYRSLFDETDEAARQQIEDDRSSRAGASNITGRSQALAEPTGRELSSPATIPVHKPVTFRYVSPSELLWKRDELIRSLPKSTTLATHQ